MIKGCSKMFFFGIIVFAALYYIFSHYEFDFITKAEDNLKAKLEKELIDAVTNRVKDVTVEATDVDYDELKQKLTENIDKIDVSQIEEMYNKFSSFISDKVLDSKELNELKKYLDEYEKSDQN
ncbi:MAG: hypothetical protein D6830_00160 [Ignavibacteria bacterium]|nr:MAG: hypothetical protein D6830_00160 [Ignavibacteria bacterium]